MKNPGKFKAKGRKASGGRTYRQQRDDYEAAVFAYEAYRADQDRRRARDADRRRRYRAEAKDSDLVRDAGEDEDRAYAASRRGEAVAPKKSAIGNWRDDFRSSGTSTRYGGAGYARVLEPPLRDVEPSGYTGSKYTPAALDLHRIGTYAGFTKPMSDMDVIAHMKPEGYEGSGAYRRRRRKRVSFRLPMKRRSKRVYKRKYVPRRRYRRRSWQPIYIPKVKASEREADIIADQVMGYDDETQSVSQLSTGQDESYSVKRFRADTLASDIIGSSTQI
jgi:hypothetical protein